MSTAKNYSRLFATLLLAAGLGLIAWTGLGYIDRYFPQLLGKHAVEEGVVVNAQTSASRPMTYNVNKIVSAHLFGKADQKVVAKTVTAAPQTKLKLKLIGVMASEDQNMSRAMIQVNSKGMKTYSIGDSIDGTDAQLHMVENEKVILDRKGNLESLAMGLPRTKIDRSKSGAS